MVTEANRAAPTEVRPAILVVDDMDDAREMLARLIRLAGYRVITASGGDAALLAVDAETPALMVLDQTMPGMDGLEVLRRLRDNPRHRALPVVLFTAVSDQRTVAAARNLGAADYLIKGSVAAADLIACIAKHRRVA